MFIMFFFIKKMPIHLVLVSSIFALAVAYVSQYGFGFEPCALCYYQRIPYFVVIVFSFVSLSIRMADHRNIQTCIGLIFFFGALLAFYHFGVEQYWWSGSESCSQTQPLPMNFNEFQEELLTKMPKRCDEVEWTLFGLSMSVYNMIASLVLGFFSIFSRRLVTPHF